MKRQRLEKIWIVDTERRLPVSSLESGNELHVCNLAKLPPDDRP
jgi:hypothetical protein